MIKLYFQLRKKKINDITCYKLVARMRNRRERPLVFSICDHAQLFFFQLSSANTVFVFQTLKQVIRLAHESWAAET